MVFLSLLAIMVMTTLALSTSTVDDVVNRYGKPNHNTVIGKECFDVTIPVTVTSTNFILPVNDDYFASVLVWLPWGLPQFKSDFDVAGLAAAFANRTVGTNESSFVPIIGTQLVTASYNISGTYCKPVASVGSTLLVATHGLTLNKYYWHSGYQPSNYSFVDYVTDKGYSVFFYDRLGVGLSSKIGGYVNNANMQAAILEQLINYIRDGKLKSPKNAAVNPKNVVLVGHSMGSLINNLLLTTKPDIVDATVLTGWALSFSAPGDFSALQLRIANQLHPAQYSGYDTGALCFVDIYACVQLFYQFGMYDTNAAEWSYNLASPFDIMEFMSIGALSFEAPKVTAPVLILSGEYDSVVCGGYCPGVEGSVIAMFPNAKLEALLQPRTGHNLNFHYNATGSYEVITDFLIKNGLGPN